MVQKLTQTLVDRLTSKDKYYRVSDPSLPGFYVKVWPSGKRIYTIRYRRHSKDQVREHNLAPAHIMSLKDARELAKTKLAELWTGEGLGKVPDTTAPAVESKTVNEVIDAYLSSPAFKDSRPRTQRMKLDSFDRFLRPTLGDRQIRSLTKGDIVKMIDAGLKFSTPSVLTTALAYTRALLNWAEQREWVDRNVASGIPKPGKTVVRDRWLKEKELRKLMAKLPAVEDMTDNQAILYTLILTGKRVGEVMYATADEVNQEEGTWTIPPERVKGNREQVLPMSSEVARIFKSRKPGKGGRLFKSSPTNFRRLTDKLSEGMGGEHWTPHDLRRTLVTNLQKQDPSISDDMLRRIINHAEGSEGALKHYAHYDYIDEQRAILEKWQNYLLSL